MKNKTHQEKTVFAPIYLKFNRLTENAQATLKKRLDGDCGGFLHQQFNIRLAYIFILLSVIWVGLIFYLADDYLWRGAKLVLYSSLTFLALCLLSYNIFRVYKYFTSLLKSGILVTSHYVILSDFNNLKFWQMDQLFSVNSNHRFQNEVYNSTEITLHLENNSKNFVIKNRAEAEEIVEEIEYNRKLFIEAVAKNDEDYLDSAEDFVELKKQKSDSPISVKNLLSYILTGFVSALVSVAVMFGAISANNYFDDKRSWNDTESVNRASSYRKYLQTHQNGRWNAQASQNLQNLYDAAEQKYQDSLNKGFDPKAVEAVKQAIRYAKETNNYRVKLIYERHNEISPNIVEVLKKENEVKKVLSVGDAFSDERLKEREKILSDKIIEGFNVVIPNDIIEFSSECNDECITFLVKYKLDSDSVYFDLRQKSLPDNDRTSYPGIWFDWNFNIKTPTQSATYNFRLESNPADEISYNSNFDGENIDKEEFTKLLDTDKNLIYDSMLESAFDDFKANLVYRLGVGEEPKKEKENTESEKAETKNTKQESKKN